MSSRRNGKLFLNDFTAVYHVSSTLAFLNNKTVIQMQNKLYVEREQWRKDAHEFHVTVRVPQYSMWSLAVHVNATDELYSQDATAPLKNLYLKACSFSSSLDKCRGLSGSQAEVFLLSGVRLLFAPIVMVCSQMLFQACFISSLFVTIHKI